MSRGDFQMRSFNKLHRDLLNWLFLESTSSSYTKSRIIDFFSLMSVRLEVSDEVNQECMKYTYKYVIHQQPFQSDAFLFKKKWIRFVKNTKTETGRKTLKAIETSRFFFTFFWLLMQHERYKRVSIPSCSVHLNNLIIEEHTYN